MAAVALFMVGRLAKFNDIFTSTVPTINNFSNHALRINCLTLFVQLKIQNNILFLYTPYFPSYCLGNMIAAQLWHRIKEVYPDIEEDFARGEFGRLLEWLRENVHYRGRQYNTLELTRKITGQELSPEGLIRYLKERYLPLYT